MSRGSRFPISTLRSTMPPATRCPSSSMSISGSTPLRTSHRARRSDQRHVPVGSRVHRVPHPVPRRLAACHRACRARTTVQLPLFPDMTRGRARPRDPCDRLRADGMSCWPFPHRDRDLRRGRRGGHGVPALGLADDGASDRSVREPILRPTSVPEHAIAVSSGTAALHLSMLASRNRARATR